MWKYADIQWMQHNRGEVLQWKKIIEVVLTHEYILLQAIYLHLSVSSFTLQYSDINVKHVSDLIYNLYFYGDSEQMQLIGFVGLAVATVAAVS